MQFISSDTNIWIDFSTIGYLHAPFLLQDIYTFLMSSDALTDEVLSPPDLCAKLEQEGLQRTELSDTEFQMSINLAGMYPRISVYDTFALAIAKCRQIILLSGDRSLRQAAEAEGVEVHGSLWLIDRLWQENKLTREEYKDILTAMKACCGRKIRLPLEEIQKRLNSIELDGAYPV